MRFLDEKIEQKGILATDSELYVTAQAVADNAIVCALGDREKALNIVHNSVKDGEFRDEVKRLIRALKPKKDSLEWRDLWRYGLLGKDSAGRWVIAHTTPESIREYLGAYRSPSRNWPDSYARALLTKKFAKYIREKDPETAKRIGLA